MVFIYVLVGILGAGALLFAVQNTEPVTVNFLDWRSVGMPLSFLLLLSVFVGVVFASVSGFAKQIELKLKIRRLENRIAQLSARAPQSPRVEPKPQPPTLTGSGAIHSH
jgi:uncharacterized integral membrane protein